MTHWDKMAKEAYIAYSKAVDGIAFNRDVLPEWEQVSSKVQKAWVEAVKRAIQYNIELKNG